MQPQAKLYYIHDPMCRWCYTFLPVWINIRSSISEQYILGGLASDSDQPMPLESVPKRMTII